MGATRTCFNETSIHNKLIAYNVLNWPLPTYSKIEQIYWNYTEEINQSTNCCIYTVTLILIMIVKLSTRTMIKRLHDNQHLSIQLAGLNITLIGMIIDIA